HCRPCCEQDRGTLLGPWRRGPRRTLPRRNLVASAGRASALRSAARSPVERLRLAGRREDKREYCDRPHGEQPRALRTTVAPTQVGGVEDRLLLARAAPREASPRRSESPSRGLGPTGSPHPPGPAATVGWSARAPSRS